MKNIIAYVSILMIPLWFVMHLKGMKKIKPKKKKKHVNKFNSINHIIMMLNSKF